VLCYPLEGDVSVNTSTSRNFLLSSHSSRRDRSGFNGCCTAMWKANGKTTTLQLFLDSLSPNSPKTEKLSLEGTMDLSRDRLILELELTGSHVQNREDIFWEVLNRIMSYIFNAQIQV
jgi:hypothetical protein